MLFEKKYFFIDRLASSNTLFFLRNTVWYFSILLLFYSHSALSVEEQRVKILSVGDVLLHKDLQIQGLNKGFNSLWFEAEPYFQQADVVYANLEGPTAEYIRCDGNTSKKEGIKVEQDCRKSSNSILTSYPRFNYHSLLLKDLRNSGVDIVSTANNHSLDRSSKGLEATIDALHKVNLKFTGTRKSKSDSFYDVLIRQGKTIAFLACTYATNGIIDKKEQVLHCFTKEMEELVSNLSSKYDALIITPHWGFEYHLKPNKRQKKYARKWLDLGASAVVGSHPHVLQPFEQYQTKDGRNTLIIYSLGNFVSGQTSFNKTITALFCFDLVFYDNKVFVDSLKYIPAVMKHTSEQIYLGVLREDMGLAYKDFFFKVLSLENMKVIDKQEDQ